MANEEHVKILKEKGVRAWNEWRKQNPETKPDLNGARLSGAHLNRVNLSVASINEADLSWADLIGASLIEVNLRRADLTEANLSGANLNGADLSQADLGGAKLEGSTMRTTSLGSNDLSKVDGLETVRHLGPSWIGIDTIYRSGGKIPEMFLRGAGVPESFITFMKSLTTNPIEYYSCFISYSSKDQEFADLLHSQMRGKDLRVWLATEDLKIGDKFRAKIDEAIRVYDKLLLVLSKDSVKSPWVESEVEAAFEKERKQNRIVLFPIRLDDAVMKTDKVWAAEIRRTRHIGGFRKWKEHDEFQKAFARLMRDLKAG